MHPGPRAGLAGIEPVPQRLGEADSSFKGRRPPLFLDIPNIDTRYFI